MNTKLYFYSLAASVMLVVMAGFMASCTIEDNPAVQTATYRTPLTLEAIEGGTITFLNNAANPVTYQINHGEEQTIPVTASNSKGTKISVSAGDIVTFKANNTTYGGTSNISCSADCYIYGNVMSLIDAENYPTLKAFDTTNGTGALGFLFDGNTHIKNDGKNELFLPATTLAEYCYFGMFSGCTGLTEAPELPATTLAYGCYSMMFYGWTSLTEAPKLPATTLADYCYFGMFAGCASLTAAPELPATTLTEACYIYMFADCSSLTAAPALPAKTLTVSCYDSMFQNCTKLASVSCSATDISADDCTTNWLQDVAATGTFTTPSTTSWESGASGIPEGWTRIDK